jgi:hypothetical protein
VFGSLGKGDGDPSLNLFGDDSAPNQRQLARQFVTLDNFYADGAVSSDGWEWATASESNAYNEHLWPVAYSSRGRGDDVYTNQATDPGKITGDSRIWDRLDDAGVSYRNYGMWAGGPLPAKVFATEPRLSAHTDPNYAAQNGDIRDNTRVDEWLKEFTAADSLPTMQFVRLGNDHTFGTSVGKPTPKAAVADNDLALGRIVDAVSHSQYWKDTAIFVTEDDAQNGPDHVDAHRSVCYVISPWIKKASVDHSFHNTSSCLRTIELLLGLPPMCQYDAIARPIMNWDTAPRNDQPFTAILPPAEIIGDTNPARNQAAPISPEQASLIDESEKMDFSVADRAPADKLNDIIWKLTQGATAKLPPTPTGIAGVTMPKQKDDDDD